MDGRNHIQNIGFSFRGSISVTNKRHYLGPSGLSYPEKFLGLTGIFLWDYSVLHFAFFDLFQINLCGMEGLLLGGSTLIA